MKVTNALPLLLALGISALPVAASAITTTFAGGNRFTGNMFDLTVGAQPLTLNGFNVNVDSGKMTIDVYVKKGSYVGSETNPAAWTLIAATAITGSGAGTPTPVSISPYLLSASTLYGMYVTIDSTVDSAPFMYYTNGSTTYANSDLNLKLGSGIGGKFGNLSVTQNRIWNGTVDYTVKAASTPEPATALMLACALPGIWLLRRRFSRADTDRSYRSNLHAAD